MAHSTVPRHDPKNQINQMSGKPGRSGGKRARAGRKPGPVSAAKRELADLAKAHAAAALQTLVSIHSDTGQSAAARVSAAVAILDRGYGRPAQMLANTGKDDPDIKPDIRIVIVDPKARLIDREAPRAFLPLLGPSQYRGP